MLEAACPFMKTMFSIDFKLLKAAIWCHSQEKHTQSDSLKQEYRITFSHRRSRRRLRGPCHWGSFHWGWNGQRWRGVRYVWLRWLRINVVFAKRMPMKLNIHYLHSWATSRLMSPSSENGALRDETSPHRRFRPLDEIVIIWFNSWMPQVSSFPPFTDSTAQRSSL